MQKVSDTAGVGMTEKFANENRWNLVSVASTEPDILLGVIPPLPPIATYVMRDTLAIAGLTNEGYTQHV